MGGWGACSSGRDEETASVGERSAPGARSKKTGGLRVKRAHDALYFENLDRLLLRGELLRLGLRFVVHGVLRGKEGTRVGGGKI